MENHVLMGGTLYNLGQPLDFNVELLTARCGPAEWHLFKCPAGNRSLKFNQFNIPPIKEYCRTD
jgi:hypothetical protein